MFGGSQASYDAHNPPYLLTHQRFTGLAGWFEAGAQDSEGLQAARTLQGLAASAGIDTCIATPPGGARFRLLEAGLLGFAAVAVLEAEAHAGAAVRSCPLRLGKS